MFDALLVISEKEGQGQLVKEEENLDLNHSIANVLLYTDDLFPNFCSLAMYENGQK